MILIQTEDFKEIAKKMANEPKKTKGDRTAIVTQGSKPVLVARTGSNKIDEFPVPQLDDDKIVDTNGAGDALTGGFFGYVYTGKTFRRLFKMWNLLCHGMYPTTRCHLS